VASDGYRVATGEPQAAAVTGGLKTVGLHPSDPNTIHATSRGLATRDTMDVSRRHLLGTGSAGVAVAGCSARESTVRDGHTATRRAQQSTPGTVSPTGYVVSKANDGTVQARRWPDGPVDFEGEHPMAVAQSAYDAMAGAGSDVKGLIESPGEQTGFLWFAPDTFRFQQPLVHYASRIRVTAPGALFRPAAGYTGYLVKMVLTDRTTQNRIQPVEGSVLDHVFLEGMDRCRGIYVRKVDRATIGPISVYGTDGPGMVIDEAREVTINDLTMRYAGNEDEPALDVLPGERAGRGDAPNNLYFYGLVSTFPTKDNVLIGSNTDVKNNKTRGIFFFGAQLHQDLPDTETVRERHPGAGEWALGQGVNVSLQGVKDVRIFGSNLNGTEEGTGIVTCDPAPSGEPCEGVGLHGCNVVGGNEAGLQINAHSGPLTLQGNRFSSVYSVDFGDAYTELAADGNTFDATVTPFLGYVPPNRSGPGIGDARSIHAGYVDDWGDGAVEGRLWSHAPIRTATQRKVVPARRDWTGGTASDGGMLLAPGESSFLVPEASVLYGTWSVDLLAASPPTGGELAFHPMRQTSGKRYSVVVGAGGDIRLDHVTGGDAETIVSGNGGVTADASTTLLLHRAPDGTVVLEHDDTAVGDATSNDHPRPSGRFVGFENDFDVPVTVETLRMTAGPR
jgi:hypothetical protein